MAQVQGEEIYLAHSGQEVDDNIDEVVAARGSEASLSARLADIVSDFEADQQRQETEIGVVANAGAKNLLHFDAIGSGGSVYGNTYTHYGITYTLNADMTVTATGTADSANNSFAYLILNGSFAPIDDYCDGKHIVSGCPANGSTSKYRIYITKSGWGSLNEIGSGAIIPDKGTYTGLLIACFVSKGYAIPAGEPLVFKPMIRPASIADSTFQPYAPTNRELYEMILALQNGRSVQSSAASLMQAGRIDAEMTDAETDESEEEER